ncbi:MAG: FAD-dependent oxidoreductase [Candidatus Glassbacteria bacterium]|nr:FAD-dependent oxidoreductase [Candidatus Glassbacteria bacterium]
MSNMPKVIKGFTEETRTISFPEAIEEAGRCYLCHDAPCCKASPTGTDIPGFISRMRSRNFRGALRLVRESNFFPGITSRVSPYDEQCEEVCLRRKYGGPIRISELERLLADCDIKAKRPYLPAVPESVGKTVAIVGSGPTGLAAAVELVLSGCKVIIYESSRIPGGVLTKGVPSYLINDRVIDHEVGSVLNLGVDLVTGINVGENINLVSLKNSYDAMLLAIGMGRARRLDVASSNKSEIFTGIEILESLKLKEKRLRVGDKVVVVGGGNVSLDVASSMRKLDVESVTLLYRKDRQHMPVFQNRYDICRDSGVKILFRAVLKQITTGPQEAIKEVVCLKTELKESEDGKVGAVPVEGSEFVLPADTVIFSIGQEVDRMLVDLFSLETGEDGKIKVDPETNRTNDPFIFAAGSCVERTDTIIEAVAKGREAARRIVKQLLG